jgi:hypothetical protein
MRFNHCTQPACEAPPQAPYTPMEQRIHFRNRDGYNRALLLASAGFTRKSATAHSEFIKQQSHKHNRNIFFDTHRGLTREGLRFCETARVFVCVDHVASVIVNANHSIM